MQLPTTLTIDTLANILAGPITLSESDIEAIQGNYNYLHNKLKEGNIHYGINTGFGSLCNVKISDSDLSQLQENLVVSHACGMGDEVDDEIVKIILLLKIKNLSKGFSGVHINTVEALIHLYNNNLLPIIYEQGSLGASGDLAPLAHLSLPLLGLGTLKKDGVPTPASALIVNGSLQKIKLHAKEGLALLNGTQFMSGYASWALMKANNLMLWADLIMALSLEAYDGRPEPFFEQLHTIRPHKGQIATAANIRTILNGSTIQQQPKVHVQDPYSFRCVPQVHGATKDAMRHIQQVVEIEINAVTDNPTVFEAHDHIVSGGNFHGQPLAINLDYAAIAMSELANISERRTYLLISGQRNLPPFLAKDAGLNSGFMIAQYTAASIVSANKQLCTPASIDSIVSSNGQEDHVSMGANAATKLKKVIENVQRVLAIELLTAAQALEMGQGVDKSAPIIQQLVGDFRKVVSFNDQDRIMHDDLIIAEKFLDNKASKYFDNHKY